jgi:hypothetical protein
MHWRIRSVLLRIAAVILAALHARLLWQRIEDLSIAEPEVMARWGAAAIAAAAGLLLLRLRVSWRSWVVFWTVIVLLHAAAPVVFVVVPLILLLVAAISARESAKPSLLLDASFACPIALLPVLLPSRAPPHR